MRVKAFAGFAIGMVVVAVLAYAVQGTVERPDADTLSRVVKEIEALDALRSGLASSFSGEPNQSTFVQVCRPVGAQARQLAEDNGWTIQQLAERNRNPGHRLDAEAERVFRLMAEDPGLMGLWVRTEISSQAGYRYFRRIVVEPACLACHGAKDSRPQFVKDRYPEDRAYGFQVGDLRGLYAVFVADAQ